MERGCASATNENRKPIEQDKVPSQQQVVGNEGSNGCDWVRRSGCPIDRPVAIFIHLGSLALASWMVQE